MIKNVALSMPIVNLSKLKMLSQFLRQVQSWVTAACSTVQCNTIQHSRMGNTARHSRADCSMLWCWIMLMSRQATWDDEEATVPSSLKWAYCDEFTLIGLPSPTRQRCKLSVSISLSRGLSSLHIGMHVRTHSSPYQYTHIQNIVTVSLIEY